MSETQLTPAQQLAKEKRQRTQVLTVSLLTFLAVIIGMIVYFVVKNSRKKSCMSVDEMLTFMTDIENTTDFKCAEQFVSVGRKTDILIAGQTRGSVMRNVTGSLSTTSYQWVTNDANKAMVNITESTTAGQLWSGTFDRTITFSPCASSTTTKPSIYTLKASFEDQLTTNLSQGMYATFKIFRDEKEIAKLTKVNFFSTNIELLDMKDRVVATIETSAWAKISSLTLNCVGKIQDKTVLEPWFVMSLAGWMIIQARLAKEEAEKKKNKK